MADPIVPDLLDMMPDELIAQPVVLDEYGGFMASGQAVVVPCYIEEENRVVREPSGREVTSTAQAYCGGEFGFTVRGFKYTLPARFEPREELTAIRVRHASDENGAHHDVVMFP